MCVKVEIMFDRLVANHIINYEVMILDIGLERQIPSDVLVQEVVSNASGMLLGC